MQAVMAFAKKQGGQMAASAASGGGRGGGPSGAELGGMGRGMSVLGSLMEFAGGLQKAKAIKQEAWGERLASRQEYVVANERVNAIDAEFNRLAGDQLAAASAMGIDVGSGSVVAAREAARDEADRERRIIRNSAEANAAQRRLRAVSLKNAARNQKIGSWVSLGLDVAGTFAKAGG